RDRRRPIGRDERVVGDRHHPAARIAARITKRVELLQIDVRDPGFLAQLAQRRVIERFAVEHETAGNRPTARVRRNAALDEQHVQAALANGEDHDVDRHPNRHGPYPTTRCAFCAAARICATAPELNARKSSSMPSEKMTPPEGICDSSTRLCSRATNPATTLA